MRRTLSALSVIALGTMSLQAQHVISAKSGLINYYEGEVTAAGESIESKNGKFPEWQKGTELATAGGRAEILLTPGVFLRFAENTKAVMVENRLSDTRVKLLNGSLLLECAELLEGNAVTLTFNDYQFSVRKAGLYRLDAEDGTVRVFEGELQVAGGGQTLTLKKGKMSQIGGVLVASKFDNKQNDAFYRWASRRAEPLAVASFSAAQSIYSNGQTWNYGGWSLNPYFGFYTYIPYRGVYNSPFGYQFYSPVVISNYYQNLAYSQAAQRNAVLQNREAGMDASRGAMAGRGDFGRGGGFDSGSMGAYSGRGGGVSAAPSVGGGGSLGVGGGGGASRGGAIGGGGGGAARGGSSAGGRGK